MTWSQNTNTLVGSVLIVNMTDAMTIFNSCDLVAKRIHISWRCTDSNITDGTTCTVFYSYDMLAKTYTCVGSVQIVNWTVAMTIFNSYDLVAKRMYISNLCIYSKCGFSHNNIQ